MLPGWYFCATHIGGKGDAVDEANKRRAAQALSLDDDGLFQRLLFVPPPCLEATPADGHHNWNQPIRLQGCLPRFQSDLELQHFLRPAFDFQALLRRHKQRGTNADVDPGEKPWQAKQGVGTRESVEISLGDETGAYVIYCHYQDRSQKLRTQVVAKKTVVVGFSAEGNILADALQFAPDDDIAESLAEDADVPLDQSWSSAPAVSDPDGEAGRWVTWAEVTQFVQDNESYTMTVPDGTDSAASPGLTENSTVVLNFQQLQPGRYRVVYNAPDGVPLATTPTFVITGPRLCVRKTEGAQIRGAVLNHHNVRGLAQLSHSWRHCCHVFRFSRQRFLLLFDCRFCR